METKIRKYWNLKTFLHGDATHKKWKQQSPFDDTDEDGVGGKTVWLDTDAAIADPMTWVGINVVYDVGRECEHIGRWSEQCGCPEHQPTSDFVDSVPSAGPKVKTGTRRKVRRQNTARGFNPDLCPFRGCRAPELAAGEGLRGQLGLLMSNRSQILKYISQLPLQPSAQTALLNDWHVGRSRLWSSSETSVLAGGCAVK